MRQADDPRSGFRWPIAVAHPIPAPAEQAPLVLGTRGCRAGPAGPERAFTAMVRAAASHRGSAQRSLGAAVRPPTSGGPGFARVWILGLHDPWRCFEELRTRPAPSWGLRAVLIRWLVTSLTTTLALHLLGRTPFTPPRLTFWSPQEYYLAQVFFLPLFGVALWLLGGALTHLLVRLSGKGSDMDRILNVIGMTMLIPSPVVWLWDWSMIALDRYHLTVMAVSHSLFALWGALLYAVGLRVVLGLRWPQASLLAVALTATYIALASLIVR